MAHLRCWRRGVLTRPASSVCVVSIGLAIRGNQVPAELAPDLFGAGRRVNGRVRAPLEIRPDRFFRRAGRICHGAPPVFSPAPR